MKIAVQLEPAPESAAEVAYKWDPDTEILSAQLSQVVPGVGMSGSVGLEGSDGSWLILDVHSGRINGVEIAVWPDIRKVPTLPPPSQIENAHVVINAGEAVERRGSRSFALLRERGLRCGQRKEHRRCDGTCTDSIHRQSPFSLR